KPPPSPCSRGRSRPCRARRRVLGPCSSKFPEPPPGRGPPARRWPSPVGRCRSRASRFTPLSGRNNSASRCEGAEPKTKAGGGERSADVRAIDEQPHGRTRADHLSGGWVRPTDVPFGWEQDAEEAVAQFGGIEAEA